MSPATPFSVASLPNHTKLFELVHVVTSVEDFACYTHCIDCIDLYLLTQGRGEEGN